MSIPLHEFQRELEQYVLKVEALENDHAGLEAKLAKAKELWREQALSWGEKQRLKGRTEGQAQLLNKDAEIQNLKDQLAVLQHTVTIERAASLAQGGNRLRLFDFDVKDQHISVFNTSLQDVSLKGYSLSIRSICAQFDFPDNIVLPPRSSCSVWWGKSRVGLHHPEGRSLHWPLEGLVADDCLLDLIADSGTGVVNVPDQRSTSSREICSSVGTNQQGLRDIAAADAEADIAIELNSTADKGKKRASGENFSASSSSAKRSRAVSNMTFCSAVVDGPRPWLCSARRPGPLCITACSLQRESNSTIPPSASASAASSNLGTSAGVASGGVNALISLSNFGNSALSLGADWRLLLRGRVDGGDFNQVVPLCVGTLKGKSNQLQSIETGASLDLLISVPLPPSLSLPEYGGGIVLTSVHVVDGDGHALASHWGVASLCSLTAATATGPLRPIEADGAAVNKAGPVKSQGNENVKGQGQNAKDVECVIQ